MVKLGASVQCLRCHINDTAECFKLPVMRIVDSDVVTLCLNIPVK